jgi:hypothetical protein
MPTVLSGRCWALSLCPERGEQRQRLPTVIGLTPLTAEPVSLLHRLLHPRLQLPSVVKVRGQCQ